MFPQGWCALGDIERKSKNKIIEITRACKFSNRFIESVRLGNEVCGQYDTIRASFLFGSACRELEIS